MSAVKIKFMKTAFLLFISALVLSACSKGIDEKNILAGTYYGTFQRTEGIGNKEIAKVSIKFTSAGYSGTSDKPRYPAICNGTYSINGNNISFTNSCAWTADFDWTLILNDDYTLKAYGDSIEISRQYAGQMSDIYKLKKQ
jgi:hypothetical protein